ncbi:VanZ family protein [Treponema sp. HNW]|uniref:VanZ family protein n=1 Tax=Treponema sp. HNW TaxID=3116654 RepID=UPI003D096732
MKLPIFLKKALLFIPALCITGISWYLSSKTHIQTIPRIVGIDKILHCTGYAGLAFWTAFALLPRSSSAKNYRRRLIIAFSYPVLYGIIDEIHQYRVPGREPSVWDWTADIIGTFIGIWVYVRVRGLLNMRILKNNIKDGEKK